MDSVNTNNQSKSSAFNKFKRLLHKYYLTFSKIDRVAKDLHEFIILLYDVMMTQVMMQQDIECFILTHKQKRLLMKATLMIYLSQAIM